MTGSDILQCKEVQYIVLCCVIYCVDNPVFFLCLFSKLLGGGIESMAITEAFGGKLQLCPVILALLVRFVY